MCWSILATRSAPSTSLVSKAGRFRRSKGDKDREAGEDDDKFSRDFNTRCISVWKRDVGSTAPLFGGFVAERLDRRTEQVAAFVFFLFTNSKVPQLLEPRKA